MRRWALRVHRWSGLAIGAVLLVSAASGLLLLSGDWLERGAQPGIFHSQAGEPAPLERVLASIAGAHPDLRIVRLRLPRDPADVYEAWLESDTGPRVYVDQVTAAVRGSHPPAGTIKGFVFTLHSQLFARSVGKALLGASATGLLLLIVSGLVVWWPGRQKLRLGFRIRRGRAFLADAHRVTGFLAAPVLAMTAFTGLSLIAPVSIERFVVALSLAAPRPSPPIWPGAARAGNDLPVDALITRANAAMPGGQVSWLYFPPASGGWFTVRKRLDGEVHPNGKSFVYLNPTSGDFIARDARENAGGPRLFDALYPAHIGRVLGRAPQVMAGLMLGFLVISGWMVWWRRRPVRRQASSSPPPAL